MDKTSPLEDASVEITVRHPNGPRITFSWPAGYMDFPTINELCNKLSKAHYRPIDPIAYEYTPDGLPICPKHGIPMTKREKQGDVWYSHNVGTEEFPMYCRGHAGNSSPGWEH